MNNRRYALMSFLPLILQLMFADIAAALRFAMLPAFAPPFRHAAAAASMPLRPRCLR